MFINSFIHKVEHYMEKYPEHKLILRDLKYDALFF